MWHRPMAEMLADVFEGFTAARTDYARLRARSVEMTLPVEVRLEDVAGEMTFIADLPVWRWRTDFDPLPSRLRITWEAL